MKTKNIATWIAITLLTAGTAFAQGGTGRRGGGYGTPPKTDEERATRQVERQQANRDNRATRGNRAGLGQTWGRGQGQCPGNCDGTGPGQGNCDGSGQGQSRGRGNGPRDGSGPRGGTANCPAGT